MRTAKRGQTDRWTDGQTGKQEREQGKYGRVVCHVCRLRLWEKGNTLQLNAAKKTR